jgi:holin-like protein
MKHCFHLLFAVLALIFCWFVGDYLSLFIKLPASLLGLLVMLSVLLSIKRVPKSLDVVSAWALRSMALLFIPVTVGAAAYLADLGAWLWLLLLAILLSTALSLAITAWLAQKLLVKSAEESAGE